MLRLIGAVGLLLVVWWAPVEAVDRYVCDCGPGADPDCIAGNDAGAGNGFFLYNDIDDVEIVNVAIDGLGIGVHLAGSNPCSADPECDGRNDRLGLRDSTVTNNHTQGWLGASMGSSPTASKMERRMPGRGWLLASPKCF